MSFTSNQVRLSSLKCRKLPQNSKAYLTFFKNFETSHKCNAISPYHKLSFGLLGILSEKKIQVFKWVYTFKKIQFEHGVLRSVDLGSLKKIKERAAC